MSYLKECARFLAALYIVFILGAIEPVLGYVSLALFAVFIVPRFLRASAAFTADRQYERKRRNIETQLIAGAQDAQMVRNVARDMRERGEL